MKLSTIIILLGIGFLYSKRSKAPIKTSFKTIPKHTIIPENIEGTRNCLEYLQNSICENIKGIELVRTVDEYDNDYNEFMLQFYPINCDSKQYECFWSFSIQVSCDEESCLYVTIWEIVSENCEWMDVAYESSNCPYTDLNGCYRFLEDVINTYQGMLNANHFMYHNDTLYEEDNWKSQNELNKFNKSSKVTEYQLLTRETYL